MPLLVGLLSTAAWAHQLLAPWTAVGWQGKLEGKSTGNPWKKSRGFCKSGNFNVFFLAKLGQLYHIQFPKNIPLASLQTMFNFTWANHGFPSQDQQDGYAVPASQNVWLSSNWRCILCICTILYPNHPQSIPNVRGVFAKLRSGEAPPWQLLEG